MITALVAYSLGGALLAPTTNPLGFLYDLPAGWTVAQTSGTYQVLRRPGQTENELYVIGGQLDFKSKSSLEARLVEEDDAMLQNLNEAWRRVAEPAAFMAGTNRGMFLRYAINIEGTTLEGRLFTLVAEKRRFGLFGLFPTGVSASVSSELQSIASSLRPDPKRKLQANTPLAREWVALLSGTRLSRDSTENMGSQNGGGGTQTNATLTFLPDGTFHYTSKSTSFVSAGSFSGMSNSSDEEAGQWSIRTDGSKVLLILSPTGKPQEALTLTRQGEFILLEGAAFRRSRI